MTILSQSDNNHIWAIQFIHLLKFVLTEDHSCDLRLKHFFSVCWLFSLTTGIHFPPKWCPHSGHFGGLWRVTYINEHWGFRHFPLPLLVYVFTDCTKKENTDNQVVQVAQWYFSRAVLLLGKLIYLPFYMKDWCSVLCWILQRTSS